MSIELNHTIIDAHDGEASARRFAELFGLPEPEHWGPFWQVDTANGVTLDFQDSHEDIPIEHYAFLVSESEFDAIFARIRERQLTYWADPAHARPFEINHNDGGRGVYFRSPDGHFLEILTRPYGSA